MGLKDGKLVPVVQEYVLNTYSRFDGFNVKAADDYWATTKDYWAAIRSEWDRAANAKDGIGIKEEAQTGTVISARLLELANEIADKRTTTAKAVTEASKLIESNARRL